MQKSEIYAGATARIKALLEGEYDLVAAMSTVVCELHHCVPYYDWTGFYRVARPGILKVGPYQGSHGCLTIPFERGVCGKCAREGKVQIVEDVDAIPHHIACSSTTRSEIVVPLCDSVGKVWAVLDVDSDALGAFDERDAKYLQDICLMLSHLHH